MNRNHQVFVLVVASVGIAMYPFENVNAVTIAVAKLLPLGSDVTIDSAVITNTVDLVNSTSSANFEIQDGTAGITIFGSSSFIDLVTSTYPAGTQITLDGPTTSFSGLFEIEPHFVNAITPNVGVPAPIVTTSADYQDLSTTAEGFGKRMGVARRT